MTFEEAHRAVRVRQAGHPLRDGARGPRARRSSTRTARPRPASASSTRRWRPAVGSRPSSRPGMAGVTRREIDELTERSKRFGARGLAHLAIEPGGEIKGPIAKFLSPRPQAAIVARAGAGEGDLILIVADTRRRRPPTSSVACGWTSARSSASPTRPSWPTSGSTASRCTTGTRSNERWDATHNPFSGVAARGRGAARHGIRRSGPAVAGRPGRSCPGAPVRPRPQRLGARRRVDPDPSPRAARALVPAPGPDGRGDAARSSAAVLDAFEYGAPPHGGIALGIDRWAMLFAGQTNIREVMAFPKTQSGTDPMLDAPSVPEPGQYEELGLRFVGLPAKPS